LETLADIGSQINQGWAFAPLVLSKSLFFVQKMSDSLFLYFLRANHLLFLFFLKQRGIKPLSITLFKKSESLQKERRGVTCSIFFNFYIQLLLNQLMAGISFMTLTKGKKH